MYVICGKKSLLKLGLKYITAHVGGGNIWMFSQEVLSNVADTMLPHTAKHKRFVSDMESYSIAHACYLIQTPFTGCYAVASNDYLGDEYNPLFVSDQLSPLVPYILDLASDFAGIG